MNHQNKQPMISEREIHRRYNLLLKQVETDDYYTKIDLNNRINCYVCPCGHITKTIDIDAGCTPMHHTCEQCGQFAVSRFYTDVAPEQKPSQEWYRPPISEVLKMKRNPAMLDHVFNGGLLPRKTKTTAERR